MHEISKSSELLTQERAQFYQKLIELSAKHQDNSLLLYKLRFIMRDVLECKSSDEMSVIRLTFQNIIENLNNQTTNNVLTAQEPTLETICKALFVDKPDSEKIAKNIQITMNFEDLGAEELLKNKQSSELLLHQILKTIETHHDSVQSYDVDKLKEVMNFIHILPISKRELYAKLHIKKQNALQKLFKGKDISTQIYNTIEKLKNAIKDQCWHITVDSIEDARVVVDAKNRHELRAETSQKLWKTLEIPFDRQSRSGYYLDKSKEAFEFNQRAIIDALAKKAKALYESLDK